MPKRKEVVLWSSLPWRLLRHGNKTSKSKSKHTPPLHGTRGDSCVEMNYGIRYATGPSHLPLIMLHHPKSPKSPQIQPALGTVVSTSWGAGSGGASVFGYPVGLDSSFTGATGATGAGWGAKFSGTTPPLRAISTLRVMNLETSQVRRESTWRSFFGVNKKWKETNFGELSDFIFWMINM